MRLSTAAAWAIQTLEDAGFEAYAVGGCVRDSLMGREVGDHDITTNALVAQTHMVFEAAGAKVLDTGAEHGTVTVVVGEGSDREALEITTYRVDGEYLDNRHPDKVEFARSLEEDLARRDFTVNAMAYNPRQGIVDLYGGREDLEAGVIRCVGDPDKRFSEDALRIMRALRFASQLSFAIEDETAASLVRNAHLLENISRERIGVEMTKLLCGPGVEQVLLDYADVIGVVLPQVLPMRGFGQNNGHHVHDVYGHSVAAVANIPPRPVLRYAALLHDTGKPATYCEIEGVACFPGHEAYSARIAREACQSLRLPNTWADEICTIIAYHGEILSPDRVSMLRWLNRLGEQTLRDLLWMKRADIMGLDPKYHRAVARFDEMESIVDWLLAEGACYRISDLAVDGSDLIALGMEQGPTIGATLSWLLDLVMAGRVPNGRETLLRCVELKLEDSNG